MGGALDGVKVLEFSEIIAAPFGGMHLADLGADVVKVEPPDGEPWRLFGQFAPGESRTFISLNRGKRGLAVDLKTAQGQEIVHKLVRSTDVVIVNYRPDTPRALGIDYDTLRALQPSLIYVQNTAFGPKGPQAHRPGYDIVAQAMTGLMSTDGKSNDAGLPVPMAPAMADFATGITIVAAVCAALFVRERTGQGQKIEASLMSTALSVQGGQFMTMSAPEATPTGRLLERLREARAAGVSWEELREIQAEARALVPNAYYRCYHTSDGIMAVACLAPALYRKFCDAIGVEDARIATGTVLVPGTDDARAAAFEFMAMCEIRLREKTTDEWLAILDKAGVPAGPFRMVDELRNDPQIRANDMVVELDHPVAGHLEMAGPLFNMTGTPAVIGRASPTIGQHTDELLREVGYSGDEIAALRGAGVIR